MRPFFYVIFIFSLSLIGCNDDDSSSEGTLNLSFSNLPELGSDYVYEGWLATGSSVVSGGRFSVDAQGNPIPSSFNFPSSVLENSDGYILTIEPANETGSDLSSPSSTHILAGDFSGSTASITIDDSRALGTDFSSIGGTYILATPTTSSDMDESSGLWFLDPSGPAASLNLPTLPSGWKYEGWAVVDGMPYTSGTFSAASGADDSAPYSGMGSAPPFPGEDFVQGSSNMPLDLHGGTVVISVEPYPDNDAAPFVFKPLVANVATDAAVHSSHNLGQSLSGMPSGVITK